MLFLVCYQAWHQRRHLMAQAFLDRFVRQNIAEIDEIEQERTSVSVKLVPVERAIYLELDHHLQVRSWDFWGCGEGTFWVFV